MLLSVFHCCEVALRRKRIDELKTIDKFLILRSSFAVLPIAKESGTPLKGAKNLLQTSDKSV